MSDIKELYDDVRAKIGDVPYPAVLRAARTRIRVFCRETFAWVFTDEGLSLAEGANQIDLFPPSGSVVVRVEQLEINSVPLLASSEEQLDRKFPGWRQREGVPTHYYYDTDRVSIRITPTATKDYISNVNVSYSLRLTKTGSVIPVGFFDEYFEVFIAGTLAELQSQKASTWYDSSASEDNEMRFAIGIADAKSRREQDHTKKTRQVAYGGV
jgi:hypothetical protein